MKSSINKKRFQYLGENLLNNIIDKSFHRTIDFENLILRIYRDKNTLDYDEIFDKYLNYESSIAIGFVKLVILSDYSLICFSTRRKLNTQFAWRLIFDYILAFRKGTPIASIGSQGFLSIELFRFESEKDRKILRLHIWDESLSNNFNSGEFEKYTIHSHLYSAQSQVLVGELINKTYSIDETENDSPESLYKIKWENKTDASGKIVRESHLEEETSRIKINQLSAETISIGQQYSIGINEFHSSKSKAKLSATLFLFNSDEGLSDISKVVGPKNDSNPGFKYEKINFLPLIYEIDRNIRKHFNGQRLVALDWMRKIHILEHAHRIESKKLNLFSEILSWSMIALPAIISGLTFYLSKTTENTQTLLIMIAIIGSVNVIIGTVNKVIKPSDLSDKHRINSQKLEFLRHKIEKYLVFNDDERLELLLENVLKEWQQITLFNVKESNFTKAVERVKRLKVYPNNSEFLRQ